jgi:hypothetical protein
MLLSYLYYRGQNNKQQIGGPISKPKMFWLGFASYQYFILSLIILFGFEGTGFWHFIIKGICVLLYLRAVIQSLLMFVFHRWIPPMGITYNILCILFLVTFYLFNYQELKITNEADNIIATFLVLISGILFVDSIYAYRFYKIVGAATKGKEAIWYASEEDPAFKKIIQLTRTLNYPFLLFFIYLFYKIVIFA